jgi:hypothetical protein
MKKNAFLLLSMLSLAAPACVITTTTRDVGTVSPDGSVFLGWHLIRRDEKTNANDQETYDVGAQLGTFSAIRLHADKPLALAQVRVIFADGERWIAPAPQGLGAEEWSAPIQLPGGPRAIHSVVVFGRSTTSLLSKLEIHGTR